MASPRAAQASLPIERRLVGRARTDCRARLQTPGASWYGRLWDLSETGARVKVDNPPEKDTMCLIGWQANEIFCKVVWSSDDMCGLLFERPIAYSVVLETLGEPEPEEANGPAASVGNIPVGRRRGDFKRVDDSQAVQEEEERPPRNALFESMAGRLSRGWR